MGTPKDFEWDEPKAESNLAKHGVDFRAAVLVFSDRHHMESIDDRHDYGERRYNATGMAAGVLTTVTYTMRDAVCRIISARPASRKERKLYEQD